MYGIMYTAVDFIILKTKANYQLAQYNSTHVPHYYTLSIQRKL